MHLHKLKQGIYIHKRKGKEGNSSPLHVDDTLIISEDENLVDEVIN